MKGGLKQKQLLNLIKEETYMKNKDGNFIRILGRLKYIQRWQLMRTTTSDDLAQHSYQVAYLTYVLCQIGNNIYHKNYNIGSCVIAALFHDVPEVVTGDMPTPIKYSSSEMESVYKNVEKLAIETLTENTSEYLHFKSIMQENNLSDEEKKIVKASDKLSAYLHTIEEEQNGNTDFLEAKANLFKTLSDTDLEEVRYFWDNILDEVIKTIG